MPDTAVGSRLLGGVDSFGELDLEPVLPLFHRQVAHSETRVRCVVVVNQLQQQVLYK